MGAVREFGSAMVKPLGAPAGQLWTYIEVPFKVDDRTVYPDGVVETSRAGRTWTALIEVKTGSALLEGPQLETYLDIARDNAFDAVISISNQMAPAPGVHPVDVDKRRLKKVKLHHLSWAEILTIAVQQRVHRGVSDPDQAWILGELIRYLEHPRSGALDFSDMGASWVPIREAVAASTLRAHDKGLADVISRWEQLLRFSALRLGRELGADVQVVLSRRELAEPALRFADQAKGLVDSGRLTGTLRIPDSIGPLGRPATRVNWLVRQLKDAQDGIRLDAFTAGSRTSMSALLGTVRDNPAVLISDPKRDLRSFRVAATSPLGAKRGTGRGGFIDSVLSAVDGFYAVVAQGLRPWAVKPPQLPKSGRTAAEDAGLDISVPPQELAEEGVPDEVAPADAPVLGAVDQGVQVAPALRASRDDDNSALEVEAEPPQPVIDMADEEVTVQFDEIVSWDRAQDRLDSERAPDATESGAGEDAPDNCGQGRG